MYKRKGLKQMRLIPESMAVLSELITVKKGSGIHGFIKAELQTQPCPRHSHPIPSNSFCLGVPNPFSLNMF